MVYARKAEGEFDYIVIGGGSGGAVVANRLTEDPGCRVLLVEAGNDARHRWVEWPWGYAFLLNNPRFDWQFMHGPEPGMGDRELPMPRGKTLGGSSSINAMMYVRGLRSDYEAWKADGLTGWGWDDVEPYFLKLEDYQGPSAVKRGRGGPTTVMKNPNFHPLSEKMLEAAGQSSVGRVDDYNGTEADGLGPGQIFFRNGRRCGSVQAYIRPAERRPNLVIATDTTALRLTFDGRRATGVELSKNGATWTVAARREVIVSGGAIGSPHLLEVSGIGQAERLSKLGIEVRHHLPAVGEYLLNHYLIFLVQKLHGIKGLGQELNGWRAVLNGARAILFRNGYLAGTPSQVAGRTLVDVRGEQMPVQFIGAPLRFTRDPVKKTVIRESEPGLMLGAYLGTPRSRGWVHATSASIADHPKTVQNMLADDRDVEGTLAALKLCREILAQPAFDPYRDDEVAPGNGVTDDEALIGYIRMAGAGGDHPVGTCRMSPDAATGVVDARLRVHGIDALRIVDASVMPYLVAANTHATAVMIGEKAADMIRADR